MEAIIRNQLVNEKADAIRHELEAWAKEHSVLQPGEQLLFSLQIKRVPTVAQEPEYLEPALLPPQRFFSRESLLKLGLSPKNAGQVSARMMREVEGMGGKPIFATMGEFLQLYPNARLLLRIPNIGRTTLRSIEQALKAAGLPFYPG